MGQQELQALTLGLLSPPSAVGQQELPALTLDLLSPPQLGGPRAREKKNKTIYIYIYTKADSAFESDNSVFNIKLEIQGTK